jgi:hypothetical protein
VFIGARCCVSVSLMVDDDAKASPGWHWVHSGQPSLGPKLLVPSGQVAGSIT